MLKALKLRPVALLWSGQALSAIGDEIYRVALIWIAVGLIGADTGYLAASASASLLLISVIGGKWADHWNHQKTMVFVDAARALLVLVPVVASHFGYLSLSLLWFIAVAISALSAFFDPALQATLPYFCPDMETLKSATGLMSTTIRLARVVGPGIIGTLTSILPTIQFFTLDGLSFAVSALSVHALKNYKKESHPRQPSEELERRLGFRESLLSGVRAVREHDLKNSSKKHPVTYAMAMKLGVGGFWALGYSLGLALLIHKISSDNVRAFGLVIGAYGIGNLAGALVLGNLKRQNTEKIMYWGYIWLGFGFILIALAPNMPCIMLAAAFAAIGGPMNDLPFVDLLQTSFPLKELPMVFRLRMALETAGTLLVMLASPTLFRWFSVEAVIGLCGIGTLLGGAVGLLRRPV